MPLPPAVTQDSVFDEYETELRRPLQALRSGKAQLRVPKSTDLFRRRPRSHFHSTPELFIQTGGATDFECPGERFRLGTGELCAMPRGVPHAETPRDLRSPYRILVCTHVPGGMILLRCHSGPTRRIHGLDSLQFAGTRAAESFHLLDDIAAAMTMPAPLSAEYVANLGQAFLLSALAELSCYRGGPRPEHSVPALVIEAERLARTSLANPQLRVSWLAGSLGCSPDHLSRLFHRHRGLTLATWISRERILHARDLLADPSCNISEVGWACGFNGPSYFIKTFQRHVGCTPKAYRLGLLG